MNAEHDFDVVAILLQPAPETSDEPFETISIALTEPPDAELLPDDKTAEAEANHLPQSEEAEIAATDEVAEDDPGEDDPGEDDPGEDDPLDQPEPSTAIGANDKPFAQPFALAKASPNRGLAIGELAQAVPTKLDPQLDQQPGSPFHEPAEDAGVGDESPSDDAPDGQRSDVRQICNRLYDAASGLATNPMLAFIAADTTLRTTSGVRRIVGDLADSFGDPVLLIDCSESGLLEKTCAGTKTNRAVRAIQSGAEEVQVSESRYPGLFVWRAGDLQTSANVMEVASVVDKLLHEFKLVVLFTDISSSQGARQLIRTSRGCVVFFSTTGTRIAAAKRLRRHLKSWGASLYGSVLVENEAA